MTIRFKPTKIEDAAVINRAYGEAPYLAGTKVVEFETQATEVFHRVHGDNKLGRWVLRKEDVQGLSPLQIKEKFNLPSVPTHMSEVHVPTGTPLRTGIVGPNSFGGSKGAVQFELLKEIDPSLFNNTTSL